MSGQRQIGACRPVELPDRMRRAIQEQGIALPQIYPGSIVRACSTCGTDVYVGPRMQEHLEAGDVVLMCLSCVSELAVTREQLGAPAMGLTNLGNPYRRQD